MLADPKFGSRIDKSRVFAAGHSAGGATVIMLAGGADCGIAVRRRSPRVLPCSAATTSVRAQLAHQLRSNRGGHSVDVSIRIQLDDVRADERRALRV